MTASHNSDDIEFIDFENPKPSTSKSVSNPTLLNDFLKWLHYWWTNGGI